MNLLEWRKAKKLDQAQAGAALGLTQGMVSRIETGRVYPGPEKIEQMIARSDHQIAVEDLHAHWKQCRERAQPDAA